MLAEAAVCAVPIQGSEASSCHSCFSPLPEGSDDYLQSQGVILDNASKRYKRYCSQRCYDADVLVSTTAPVHAVIAHMSTETKCDPVLLRFILELDSRRQLASATDTTSSGKAPDPDAQPHTNGSSSHTLNKSMDVVTCTLADVEALLSPWDRNPKGWREALTKGMSSVLPA